MGVERDQIEQLGCLFLMSALRSKECSYECDGCEHYYVNHDMGASFPMCREGCTSKATCGKFKPTRMYSAGMALESTVRTTRTEGAKERMTADNKQKILDAYTLAIKHDETDIANLLQDIVLDIILDEIDPLAPDPIEGYKFTCSGIDPGARQTTEVVG